MTSLGLASNIFQNHFFPSEKIGFSLVVNKTFDNWCKTWINNKETINIVCYGAIRQTLPTNRILLFFTQWKTILKIEKFTQRQNVIVYFLPSLSVFFIYFSLFLMLPSIFSLSAAFTGSKTGRKGSDN